MTCLRMNNAYYLGRFALEFAYDLLSFDMQRKVLFKAIIEFRIVVCNFL